MSLSIDIKQRQIESKLNKSKVIIVDSKPLLLEHKDRDEIVVLLENLMAYRSETSNTFKALCLHSENRDDVGSIKYCKYSDFKVSRAELTFKISNTWM